MGIGCMGHLTIAMPSIVVHHLVIIRSVCVEEYKIDSEYEGMVGVHSKTVANVRALQL